MMALADMRESERYRYAQVLIALGAELDARDARGWLAVHVAASVGNGPLLLAMLDVGATLPPTPEGFTVLDLAQTCALAGGDTSALMLLCERVSGSTAAH